MSVIVPLLWVAAIGALIAVSQAYRDGPPVCPNNACDIQPTAACDYCPGCGSELGESPHPSRLAYNFARVHGWCANHREYLTDILHSDNGDIGAREAYLTGEIGEDDLEERIEEELDEDREKERVME